jgi:hypothetical protein
MRTNLIFNDLKISFSIVKNFYIIAHYNAADLPMLSDFEDIKLKVSIVNKSFITLGKPFNIGKYNVYIRDTFLLSPAGNNSLKALGKLYINEGDYEKVQITKSDLSRMSNFLKRDKDAFELYALKDSIITLKHAIAMEEFYMTQGEVGIPTTLSSIGRKYVFKE